MGFTISFPLFTGCIYRIPSSNPALVWIPPQSQPGLAGASSTCQPPQNGHEAQLVAASIIESDRVSKGVRVDEKWQDVRLDESLGDVRKSGNKRW